MPTKKSEKPSAPEAWAGTADAWKKRGGPHQITLPSGQRVLARVLGLGSMAQLNGLPSDLTDAVFLHVANLEEGGLPAVIGAEIARSESDPKAAERAAKHVAEFAELTKHLVASALVEPELTVDDLAEVPEEDLEMLMRIVTGRQGFDALGVRIGVEPLDAWNTWRSRHGCPDDCPHCEDARSALSSIRLA